MSIAKAAMERGEIIGREIGERQGIEIGEKRGLEIGEEIGKEIGENIKLIRQIVFKLQKGKMPEQISEDLDEELEQVSAIYIIAQKHAPEYNIEAIYEEWKERSKKKLRGCVGGKKQEEVEESHETGIAF